MDKYQDILKQWKVPDGKSTDQAWSELQAKLNNRKTETRVISFSWKPMVSVAAAAAIIVGLIMLWPSESLKTVTCDAGDHQSVSLPDASIAWLNAGSSITFSDDWSDARTLELNGQAFFEVNKGSKFQVVTPLGVVEVLGTSFDVYARDNNFLVECRTGKVRVTAGKQTVEIAPGFMAVLEEGHLMVGEFDMSQSDWRNGEFIFEEADLSNVLDELGRQFSIQLQLTTSVEGRKYTGRFSNKDLNEALQLVCLPMGLKYTIQENNVVIIENSSGVKR
jgi:ferric-dicitrate binding protein FerR (iron transport regulator)